MYNRYIPQPDGSYRRNRIQDTSRPAPPSRPQPAPQEVCTDPQCLQGAANMPPHKHYDRPVQNSRKPPVPSSAGSFLRQLLPSNIDTEDLLVIVLLLLMAGDCDEDRNSALLTLALYLFL